MLIEFFGVDAFTAKAFSGNPAAVCLLDAPADPACTRWCRCSRAPTTRSPALNRASVAVNDTSRCTNSPTANALVIGYATPPGHAWPAALNALET